MKRFRALVLIIACLLFFQGNKFIYNNIQPSTNAFEHNNRGVRNFENKYFYEAAQEFKLAISLNPNTPQTAVFYSNLARVYLDLNHYEAGIFCLEQSIKLDETKLSYFKDLVNMYAEKQALIEAKNTYISKITNKENDYNSYLILGLIHKRMGENLKSINCLEEYQRLKPNSPIYKNIEITIKILAQLT